MATIIERCSGNIYVWQCRWDLYHGIHFVFALLGSQWIISVEEQALGFQMTLVGYTLAMFRYEPSTDAIQTIMNALRVVKQLHVSMVSRMFITKNANGSRLAGHVQWEPMLLSDVAFSNVIQ